jgi:hypothetical protein
MSSVGLSAALACACAAHASDNTEGLDACLDAALAQRPGIVIGWEVEDGTGRGFAIELVARDGALWLLTCHPGTSALRGSERATGVRDYPTLAARALIDERGARNVVRAYYGGRFIRMDYQFTWRGGALYEYELVTPDDRAAVVEVDAGRGRIVRTRSEARY